MPLASAWEWTWTTLVVNFGQNVELACLQSNAHIFATANMPKLCSQVFP